MFADLDESLKQLLLREVPLPVNDVDIAFERPDREQTSRFSRPTVDLFLFSVDENLDLIESGWNVSQQPDNRATLRWPELRVDLRYLVTVWTQAVDDEHNLLYHLYRTFRRFPELPADLRQGAMARQTRPIPLFIERGEISPLMDLWTALENTVRPSLVLRATVAVDLNDTRDLPTVRTSGLHIGPLGSPPETRYSLSGHVRAADGAPVAGASLRPSGRNQSVLSGEDGSYQITSLTGPEVEITASAPGFAEMVRTVSLPDDYDFTLSPQTGESAADNEGRQRGRRDRGGGTRS